jgi:hypothetical protein
MRAFACCPASCTYLTSLLAQSLHLDCMTEHVAAYPSLLQIYPDITAACTAQRTDAVVVLMLLLPAGAPGAVGGRPPAFFPSTPAHGYLPAKSNNTMRLLVGSKYQVSEWGSQGGREGGRGGSA